MRAIKVKKKGFTLVELSLSIVFIGVLALAIALIINSTIASYRRGLTLNQVNTVGMDLVDDMRLAVQNSSTMTPLNDCSRYYGGSGDDYDNCKKEGGRYFVTVTKQARVKLKGETDFIEVPIFGAFCTGSYSYIWNSGYLFAYSDHDNLDVESISKLGSNALAVDKAELRYKVKGGGTMSKSDFRLLKVQDSSRGVCASVVMNSHLSSTGVVGENKYNLPDNDNISNVFDMTNYGNVDEEPVDLLAKNGENDLALYSLTVATPAESSVQGNLFYSVSFILGTMQGGINIRAHGKSCAAPEDYNSNFDYCAINKFNFAAQANGS